jgi:hypothetical protein
MTTIAASLQKSIELQRSKLYSDAERMYRKVLGISTHCAEAYCGLGFALVSQDKREALLNGFREAVRLQPTLNRSLSGDEKDLVAYRKLNESNGTTIIDRTANHLDGTFGGNPTRTPSAAAVDPVDELLTGISQRVWHFSEPVKRLLLSSEWQLIGPDGPITITSIEGSGDTYVIHFEKLTKPGQYKISGPRDLADLDGNFIDEHQDGIGGEPAQDEPKDEFKLVAPTTTVWSIMWLGTSATRRHRLSCSTSS